MTNEKGGEMRGCHFQFWENNRRVNRWVREVIFQDRLGRVHYLRGDQLPHAVCLMTGESSTERGIAEILMKPQARGSSPVVSSEPKAWPSARDALHVVFGLAFFLFLRVLAAVVEAAN
jgi:hypothetical protein